MIINYDFYNAFATHNLDKCKEILQDTAFDPSEHNNNIFLYMCKSKESAKNIEIIKLFLSDSRVNPGDSNNNAIIFAVNNHNLSIVKILLADPRVDPTYKDQAIYRAIMYCNDTMVKTLLSDSRILESDRMQNFLEWACCRQNYEDASIMPIVEHLISLNIHPSLHNNRAILNAIKYNHIDVVNYLLQDTTVDASIDNNIARRLAVQTGDIDMVKCIIANDKVGPDLENEEAIEQVTEIYNSAILESKKKKKQVEVECIDLEVLAARRLL